MERGIEQLLGKTLIAIGKNENNEGFKDIINAINDDMVDKMWYSECPLDSLSLALSCFHCANIFKVFSNSIQDPDISDKWLFEKWEIENGTIEEVMTTDGFEKTYLIVLERCSYRIQFPVFYSYVMVSGSDWDMIDDSKINFEIIYSDK